MYKFIILAPHVVGYFSIIYFVAFIPLCTDFNYNIKNKLFNMRIQEIKLMNELINQPI